MKKVMTILLILILSSLLCSCFIGGDAMIINNGGNTANKNFDKVLEALQSNDAEMLIDLFSKESRQITEGFDSSVRELFEYFDGEVLSYDDWGGSLTDTSKEDDEIIQIMESTYDVKTTKCMYRFAIRYVFEDTTNPDNIGTSSLYIIKMADDTDKEYAYWGDTKFTPGINIGIPNAE